MATYKDLYDLGVNPQGINLLSIPTYIGIPHSHSILYLNAVNDNEYQLHLVTADYSVIVRHYTFIDENTCMLRRMVALNTYEVESHKVTDEISIYAVGNVIDITFIKFLGIFADAKKHITIDNFDTIVGPYMSITANDCLIVPNEDINDDSYKMRMYRKDDDDEITSYIFKINPKSEPSVEYHVMTLEIINKEAIFTDLYGSMKQYTLPDDQSFLEFQNSVLIPAHSDSSDDQLLSQHNEYFKRACNFITFMTLRRLSGMKTNEPFNLWNKRLQRDKQIIVTLSDLFNY